MPASQQKLKSAIGLMSGTSLDGIDAALIFTDGKRVQDSGFSVFLPYDAVFQKKLRGLISEAAIDKQTLVTIERELTLKHTAAVQLLLKKAKLKPKDIEVIGFHGQTIFHAPKQAGTWQIGDASLLAEKTGIAVVGDFRRRDVAAGGEGAPLVPLYHAAIAGASKKPVAIVNIGGVSNITFIAKDLIFGTDTGPGNALINDWIYRHNGKPHDAGGKIAAKGKVDQKILAKYLAQSFFTKKPPKSLDRNSFSLEPVKNLSFEDGAATLTEFTAASIAAIAPHLPQMPAKWIITGGGRHNNYLMQRLAAHLKGVMPIEEIGIDGDMVEAQAFAYLAMRAMLGLPLSLPTTTGINRPVTGGGVYRV